MIPSDTLLAQFVRKFGDETLIFLVENLYSSSIFKLVLFSATIFMFVATAISLYQRKLHKYVVVFWVTWLMAMPINNKPAYYHMLNSFASLVTIQLQQSTYNLFTHFGTNRSYPPGFVADTLIKAGSASITDPSLSKALNVLINNCVPVARISENGHSRYMNASDLFRVKISGDVGSIFDSLSFTYPFKKELLENRRFEYKGDTENCLDFLDVTLRKLYAHVNDRFFLKDRVKLYVGSMNGEMAEKWIDKWGESSPLENNNLSKTALNLASAAAIQANLLKKHFGVDLNMKGSHFKDGANSPYIEMQKRLMGDFDSTKVTYNLMNLPNSIMRMFNIDNFGSSASNLVNLNQNMMKLPYYVSTIQVFLKVIFPLVIFTPFIIASWRFISMWTVAYVLSLIIPWVMMISRSVCNIILLHTLKIEESAVTLSSDPAYLKFGLDFNAAVKMLDDTGKFLATYVETENALWKSILVIVPLVSWFASGSVSKIGISMATLVGMQVQRGVAKSVVSSASNIGKAAVKTAITKVPISKP